MDFDIFCVTNFHKQGAYRSGRNFVYRVGVILLE